MKKTLVAVAAIAAISMGTTACGGTGSKSSAAKTPRIQYDITGTVTLRWVEYDCKKKHTLSMEAMAYDGRNSGGTGSSSNSGNKAPKAEADSGSGTTDSGSSTSGSGGSTGGSPNIAKPTSPSTSAASKAPSATTPSKAPSVSPRVTKVPSGSLPTGKPNKPKGYSSKRCKTEYELFINDGTGVYEVDVPHAHYKTCGVKERFPACI